MNPGCEPLSGALLHPSFIFPRHPVRAGTPPAAIVPAPAPVPASGRMRRAGLRKGEGKGGPSLAWRSARCAPNRRPGGVRSRRAARLLPSRALGASCPFLHPFAVSCNPWDSTHGHHGSRASFSGLRENSRGGVEEPLTKGAAAPGANELPDAGFSPRTTPAVPHTGGMPAPRLLSSLPFTLPSPFPAILPTVGLCGRSTSPRRRLFQHPGEYPGKG